MVAGQIDVRTWQELAHCEDPETTAGGGGGGGGGAVAHMIE